VPGWLSNREWRHPTGVSKGRVAMTSRTPGGTDSAVAWELSPTSRKPIPDLIGDRILELVRAEVLKPGERLPTEPELARQMGVARSSLRTALQRLQAQGVVAVNRGRGWFVTSEPDRSAADLMRDRMVERDFDIVDVMEVRIALEGAAAALAATRASQGKLDEILKLARTHQQAPSNDVATVLRTDEEFHEGIVEASGNAYLHALYQMLTPVIAEWRAQSFGTAEVHDRSVDGHNQIAVQLRRRDEVGARLAMTGHLLGLYKSAARERREHDADSGPTAALSTFIDVDDQPLYEGNR
jgi:GntR family transcriptional repressor for pyruvate dehydrogenase complex